MNNQNAAHPKPQQPPHEAAPSLTVLGVEPSFHPSRATGLENLWSLKHLPGGFSCHGTNNIQLFCHSVPLP